MDISERTKILLVEDEPLLRRLLAELLHEAGFVIEEADSADRAWQMVQDGLSFDLLLTDVRMPGRLNGVELLMNVRREKGAVPGIVMSAFSDIAMPSAGNSMFFRKPFPSGDLLKAVNSLVARN